MKKKPKRRKPSRHKSVSRIDQPDKRTHGWYVRVRFRGKEASKFFPDLQSGGKRKALVAAIKHRDRTEREVGKPRTDRTVVARASSKKSDLAGVRHVVKSTRTVSGKVRKKEVYEVSWSATPNVISRTSFSIAKWGKREAFRRARALRKRKEKEMWGKAVTKD